MTKNPKLPTIWPVACHTKNIGPDSIFIAIRGDSFDGANFIKQAKQAGASKIVTADARKKLSTLSAIAWGHPAKKLKIIGVTGTKGKTTSVYALRHILAEAGYKVAMITGVVNMIGDYKFAACLTTPQPDYLHMFFAQCVQAGIEYVVMEVSAQALSLHRVDDIKFTGMVFTNLEMEHSEFYSGIEKYFAAKCKVFDFMHKNAFVVLNTDDKWANEILLRGLVQSSNKVLEFGRTADYKLKIKDKGFFGLEFNLIGGDIKLNCETTNLFGEFNAYNLAGAALCASRVGIDGKKIKDALQSFVSAPGRMEIYNLPNGSKGVVDYAHTPASFKSILGLLRRQTKDLIVVFGAGGGKDHPKRPLMGEIATQFCDTVILTNDNPRHEDPHDIVDDIIGVQSKDKFIVELDRSRAIRLAKEVTAPGSIMVLLGKGPDEYQMIGSDKLFFSDKEQLLSIL